MAITSGRQPTDRQPEDRQPEGRQPGAPGGAPATPGTFFAEGTQVDSAGIVQVHDVAFDYDPGATDVYILGTLHDSQGVMYMSIADNSVFGGDVFINQIRHGAANGVRRGTDGIGLTDLITKGFVHSVNGRQAVSTSASNGTVQHGILRDSTGEMIVNLV